MTTTNHAPTQNGNIFTVPPPAAAKWSSEQNGINQQQSLQRPQLKTTKTFLGSPSSSTSSVNLSKPSSNGLAVKSSLAPPQPMSSWSPPPPLRSATTKVNQIVPAHAMLEGDVNNPSATSKSPVVPVVAAPNEQLESMHSSITTSKKAVSLRFKDNQQREQQNGINSNNNTTTTKLTHLQHQLSHHSATSNGIGTLQVRRESTFNDSDGSGAIQTVWRKQSAASSTHSSGASMYGGSQNISDLIRMQPPKETRTSQYLRTLKLLAAVLLPILTALALGIIYFVNAIQLLLQISVVARQVEISQRLGKLVTELQRERGATTIYAAYTSNSSTAPLVNMLSRRSGVDMALAQLGNNTALDGNWRWSQTDSDPAYMQTKAIFVSELSERRTRAILPFSDSRRLTSPEHVDWYTNTNLVMIAWIARGFDDAFLVLPVINYKLILSAKDNFGLVRALGGASYTTPGGYNAVQRARFIQVQSKADVTLYHALELSHELNDVYQRKRLENYDLVKKLDIWRTTIVEGKPPPEFVFGYGNNNDRTNNNSNSAVIDGVTLSQWWFNNMTLFIDVVISGAEDYTIVQMDAEIGKRRRSANSQLIIAVLLVSPVMLLCPALVAWYLYEVRKINRHMQRFADNIALKSRALAEEKKRSEALLYQMLPKAVADRLKVGKSVVATAYERVTVMFSDIVSFTDIAAQCTPLQVVDLLNMLYLEFDAAIELFDVYKVETIGDAYMVVSGLPSANGIRHAGEIANLALSLLEVSADIRLDFLSNRRILLRIGVHTGPVVAGVVGKKMPRYCLFGDTVNTASRMESTNEALTIQISQTCADLLILLGGFTLMERGKLNIKGKGTMQTHWLLGSKNCSYVVDVDEARKITRNNLWKSSEQHLKSIHNINDQALMKDFYENS